VVQSITQNISLPLANAAPEADKVLRWVKNERMGGMVPTWVSPTSPSEKIAATLSHSAHQAQNSDFSAHLMAYQDTQTSETTPDSQTEKPFGFWDLLDMINPLQHIPLVNMAYRAITGDEIRSSMKIVGGAIYGGPVGAAFGAVDALVKDSTGENLPQAVMALAQGDLKAKTHIAIERAAYDDLPVALLEFAQNPLSTESLQSYKVNS